MSLFQCENCGCVENTALSCQGIKPVAKWFNWDGIEDRRGLLLCSACAPTLDSDKAKTEFGEWHGQFERVYLPKGMFRTADNGNLEHVETGEQDYRKHVIA